MISHDIRYVLEASSRQILLAVTVSAVLSAPALAQEPAVKDAGKAATDAGKGDAATKAPAVTDRDSIGFSQENTAAQMNELEERMFRLSEALAGLEPENAARLRLALKFSREEQILDQMRETFKLMKDAQLSKAETEVKELVAKLEHLRNLLLAEDLDFQLKLARLRQMRETLAQLDRVVKEERRELGWSRFAIEQRKRLERFQTRRPDLEGLVRDQEAVIADTKKASGDKNDVAQGGRAAIREREVKLQSAAAALANDPLFADLQPSHLRRALTQIAEAASSLEGANVALAAGAEEKALGLLLDELKRLDEQVTQTEQTIAEAEYRRRMADQAKNRGATDNLAEHSARLGDVGVGLRVDLIRAAATMRSAEQDLGKSSAASAATIQSSALDVLAKARADFVRAVERLLVELRAEIQTKLVAELTEMHDLQTSIRETIQAQAPRLAQKSRTALITLAGLSKREAEVGERTEHFLALVEETEYGIALPTTLRVLSREMRTIERWAGAGEAGDRTVALAKRIEDDLPGLVQALRRLPPKTPPAPGTPLPLDLRDRERELNRMIAELTMVRMLQSRLNDDTVTVDKSRPAAASLPQPIRQEVESLEASQDEIRDSLAKIAERLPFPDGSGQ
jgi:hypothetical protein